MAPVGAAKVGHCPNCRAPGTMKGIRDLTCHNIVALDVSTIESERRQMRAQIDQAAVFARANLELQEKLTAMENSYLSVLLVLKRCGFLFVFIVVVVVTLFDRL